MGQEARPPSDDESDLRAQPDSIDRPGAAVAPLHAHAAVFSPSLLAEFPVPPVPPSSIRNGGRSHRGRRLRHRLLRDGALGSSAADLARHAGGLAGDRVDDQPRANLRAAAEALSRADSATRSQAVRNLLDVAVALEISLGVEVEIIRGAASDLERACREHKKTAGDIEEVARAAAGLQERRDAGPRWWRFFRGWIPRRPERTLNSLESGLLHNEDGGNIALELLRDELHNREHQNLLRLARHLEQLVMDARLSCVELARATKALAGSERATDVVADLGNAATDVEREATEHIRTLRAPVVQLDACREHLRAAEAMELVLHAAEERARQRNSDGTNTDHNQPPAPAPGQGDQRRADMQGYALSGCFSLVPYLAATFADPLKALTKEERWNVNVLLSSWFTLVSTSVLLASCARHWIEYFLAMVFARIGMCGLNVFAIYFVYWILGMDDEKVLHISLGISIGVHCFFLLVACARRDV